jgi:uncharacterized protein (TIGR02271 family)
MTNAQTPESYIGKNAVDAQGDKIGSVGQVYLNDQTGQPDWITVNTGLFGRRESFAPLQGSSFNGDNVVLPFDKAVVKDAPDVADSSHLDGDEQERLYSYYQQYLSNAGGRESVASGQRDTVTESDRTGDAGYATEARGITQDRAVSQDTDVSQDHSRETVGHDTSGPTTDDAMTRSEEHLNVGTERVEAGRARLRKYVVTEQQSVTVPVSHEEVKVEREPITDANRGDAVDGPSISEEEHEVILHAERPVVQTEAVPVERVRLGTETVTEQQNVTGDVRKEQIEVHDDTDQGADSPAENR